MKKVNSNLDALIPIMEEKNKIRKTADCRNPNYVGAAAEFNWLPGYIVKLDAEQRVKGGQYLKKCITDNNLDLIIIPDQYLYIIPESYHPYTELTELSIGKKIEGIQGKDQTINVHQTKQFIKLIIETGIADLKWRNLVHCEDGKIALIDTESFWGSYYGLHSLLDNIRDKEIRFLVENEINQLWNKTNRP